MKYCKLYKIIKNMQNKYRQTRINSEISYSDLIQLQKNNSLTLIDVRSKGEYNEWHLKGAINVPLSKLNTNIINMINHNNIIIVYCQHGIRSKKAVEYLKSIGIINVYSLKGGIEEI